MGKNTDKTTTYFANNRSCIRLGNLKFQVPNQVFHPGRENSVPSKENIMTSPTTAMVINNMELLLGNEGKEDKLRRLFLFYFNNKPKNMESQNQQKENFETLY